jgi:alpha/beta superfamily hydrolase
MFHPRLALMVSRVWLICCAAICCVVWRLYAMPLVAAEERAVEEHVTFQVGDIALEGLLWLPPSPPAIAVVLCHPHPLYGGNMHNNIVTALAEAFQQAGMMTLRFNFRGVGESGGTRGEGQAEVEDVQAAVSYVLGRQTVASIVVAGYSFGSMVGLRAGVADERVHTLIGVALPVGMRDASFLTAVQKPILLISGDGDDISPLAALQALVAKLPAPKQLVTVAGADHFFAGHELEVAQAAVAFVQGQ